MSFVLEVEALDAAKAALLGIKTVMEGVESRTEAKFELLLREEKVV